MHHSMYLSFIRLFVHSFIHPSRPYIHLSARPSTYTPFHLFSYLTIYSIYLSIHHPSIYPSRPYIHPSAHPSSHAPFHHPSIYLSIYLSIYFVHSYTRTSVRPSVFLPTHHSVRLPINPVSCFNHPSVYPSIPPLEKYYWGKTTHGRNNSRAKRLTS